MPSNNSGSNASRVILQINQAAKLLNVSRDTLRRWEREGKISSSRTSGGYRIYDITDLLTQVKSSKLRNLITSKYPELKPLAEENPEITRKKLLKISQAAQTLGVSKDTLRRWEKSGKISASRTNSGYRVYDVTKLLETQKPKIKKTTFKIYQDNIKDITETPSAIQNPNIALTDPIQRALEKDFLPSPHFSPEVSLSPFESASKFKNLFYSQLVNIFAVILLTLPGLLLLNYIKSNINKSNPLISFSDSKPVKTLTLASDLLSTFSPSLSYRILGNHPPGSPPGSLNQRLDGEGNPAQMRDSAYLNGGKNPCISPLDTLGTCGTRDTLGSVLAESSPSASFLEINLDTAVKGLLSANEASISGALSVNNVKYNFPDTQGEALTFLQDDGAGNLAWANVPQPGIATTTVTGLASFSDSFFTVSTAGAVAIKSGGITTTEILNGTVANSDLASSSITVSPGSGMSGGGAVSLGGSVTLTNSGVTSITGTSNQVIASASTGAVTLTLPQNIGTGNSPTFAGLLLSGSTTGTLTLNAAATTTSYTLTLPSDDGTASYVLSTDGSGTTSWVAVGGSSCPTCVLTNPSSTQTITPTAATAIGLSIAQAATGSVDIFNVTNNAGTTKYLKVDSSGNTTIEGSTNNTGTFASSSTLTASNGFTQTTGALSQTATSGSISATGLTALTYTLSSGTAAITAPTLNLNTSSTGNTAIGNSTGTFALTSSGGLNVTTAGALTGVASIDTITTSSTALTFTSTAPTISVSTAATGISLEAGTTGIITIGGTSTGGVNIAGSGTGDVNIAGGSSATGCTVTNSTGDLACTGSITGSGTIGAWSRNSGSGYTYLANASDNVGIGTSTPTSKLYINATQTSGNIFKLAYDSAVTIAGDTTGLLVDLNSGNVTATNQNLTGVNFKIPTVTDTHTSGTKTLTGMLVNFGSGAGINQNGVGGTLEYIAGDFQLPALTQSAGTLNAYGLKVTTPATITTGGTAYGAKIVATGVGAGTLYGVSVDNITGAAGTEYAFNVAGTGWDAVLRVGSTTVINGSGVTQAPGGGTGQSSYAVGDILYADTTTSLTKLNIGASDGYVLKVASGVPVWGTVTGSSCTNCLISNPTSDQSIAPTGAGTTGLTVRQTSTASPTDDIFQVTDSAGSTKYFYVDKDGNVSTGAISNTTLTLTPTTNTTALTLVGTNVTSAKNQYINTKNSSGTIFDLSYGAAQTLAGTIIAHNLDLSTNVTATNQSASGYVVTLPASTSTSGTENYKGLVITGGALNSNTGNTALNYYGADITIPAITQTAGTMTAYGIQIDTPSSITTGGTAYGLQVNASGVGAGTLNGINITGITAGAGSETGLVVGSGWDYAATFDGNVGIGTTGPGALFTVGADKFQVDSIGRIGAGTTLSNAIGLNLVQSTTTNAAQYGALIQETGNSSATTSITGLYVSATTAASAFTATNEYGLYIANAAKGAGSTITTQTQLYIEAPTQGSTNYAAIFAGGNVGIGVAAPVSTIQTESDLYTDFSSDSVVAYSFGLKSSTSQIVRTTRTANKGPQLLFGGTWDYAGFTDATYGVVEIIDPTGSGNATTQFNVFTTSGADNTLKKAFQASLAGSFFPSGNVGIGTTAPYGLLHVGAITDVVASAGTRAYFAENYGTSDTSIRDIVVIDRTSATSLNAGGGGAILFRNRNYSDDVSPFIFDSGRIGVVNTVNTAGAAKPAMVFQTGDAGTLTEKMRITYDGNVGIGTTGPNAKLETAYSNTSQTTGTVSYTDAGIDIFNNAANTLNIGAILSFSTNYADPSTVKSIRAAIKGGTETTGNTGAGFLAFYTNLAAANSAAERMRITAAGNVGIGTTAPATKLAVVGTDSSSTIVDVFQSGTSDGSYLRLKRSRGTAGSPTAVQSGDALGYLTFNGYDTSTYGYGAYIQALATETWTTTAHGTNLVFVTATTGSTVTEKMRIQNDGNVGIGTTTPGTFVDIKQAASSTNVSGLRLTAATMDLRVYAESAALGAGDIGTFSNHSLRFFTNSGARIVVAANGDTTFTGSGGSCTITGAGGCTSDAKFKENVIGFSSTLDKIMDLRPVTYNLNSQFEDRSTQYGFIAQEVQNIFPELVVNITDSSYGPHLGLNYPGFVIPVIKGIQELNTKVENALLTISPDGLASGNLEVDKITVSTDVTVGGLVSANNFALDASLLNRTGSLASVPADTSGKVSVADSLNSLNSQLSLQESRVQSLESSEASNSAEIAEARILGEQAVAQAQSLDEKVASTSANIASLSFQINSLLGISSNNNLDLTPPSAISSTDSATIARLEVTDTLSSLNLDSTDATVSSSLKSLGQTFLGETTIAGDLSIDGAFSITEGKSLNSLPVLYLQNNPLAEKIDIFNGLITLDKTGLLKAQKLAVSDKSLGTVIIPAGDTSISISTSGLTDKSKVFVSTEKPVSIGVNSKNPSAHTFRIEISSALADDLKVDWWIVDSE